MEGLDEFDLLEAEGAELGALADFLRGGEDGMGDDLLKARSKTSTTPSTTLLPAAGPAPSTTLPPILHPTLPHTLPHTLSAVGQTPTKAEREEELRQQVAAFSVELRELKASGAPRHVLQPKVDALLELKSKWTMLQHSEPTPPPLPPASHTNNTPASSYNPPASSYANSLPHLPAAAPAPGHGHGHGQSQRDSGEGGGGGEEE
ncbi:hypothetical protein T484DRAFT_1876325, partial [Baffinella frigidus]